jgi:hypothetical protein
MTVAYDESERNSSRSTIDDVESILISEWPINGGEIARVSLDRYRGLWLINLQKWYKDDTGKFNPGIRGIALNVAHLARISGAMEDALTLAFQRGLIPTREERRRRRRSVGMGTVLSNDPLIPAYKVRRRDGGVSIAFRCPACGRIHSHGLPDPPNDEPVQSRVAHCLGSLSGRNYRLLVVGWRRGHLPICSAAEIDQLNSAICETGSPV